MNWLGYQNVSSASNVATQIRLGYNNVLRNGNNVSFTFDIHVNYTGFWSSNGAGVWYNGNYKKCNANNTEGNYNYYASSGSTSQGSNFFTYSGTVGTNDTSVGITIGFANQSYSPTSILTYVTFYVPIPESCRVSILQNTNTHNSITLDYTYNGSEPTQVDVYNDSTFLGSYYSTPITITGLTPNTTYNNLKAYGYNSSSGWGSVSNLLSIKTYPAPVTITDLSVTNITPFTCTANVSVSSYSNTNAIEYSIYNYNGTVLMFGPSSSTLLSMVFSSLSPETAYTLKGRVQTKESLVWSPLSSITFATLSDQSQGWIYYSNAWRKGKTYIKINGTWQPSNKTYVKVSGAWRDTTNN